jgi:hypothetical protein
MRKVYIITYSKITYYFFQVEVPSSLILGMCILLGKEWTWSDVYRRILDEVHYLGCSALFNVYRKIQED